MNKLFVEQKLKGFCQQANIAFEPFLNNYLSCYHPVIVDIASQINRSKTCTPLVVGISAPQGAGKSTLVELFRQVLDFEYRLNALPLSLDDFYKTKKSRNKIAQSTHSLFMTRGVPGTHDIDLVLTTISQLISELDPKPVKIPQFDKSKDDRARESQWPIITPPIDLVLLEGWCLDIKPQSPQELLEPVNSLESKEDPKAIWRTLVNDSLSKEYQQLFSLIDYRVGLSAPSFETIQQWRKEQEKKLINKLIEQDQPLNETMNEKQLERFMMFFERLTRHQFNQNFKGWDIHIKLDNNRDAEIID